MASRFNAMLLSPTGALSLPAPAGAGMLLESPPAVVGVGPGATGLAFFAPAGAAFRLHREIVYVGTMIKQSKRRITCVRQAVGGPLQRARASPLFSSFARACVGWGC